jgi:CelD/BcsL family acetyltransferase involved in cellulose biosynthesis
LTDAALLRPNNAPRGPLAARLNLRADAAGLAARWRRLEGEAVEANVFQGPDVLLPQLRAFAPAAEILSVERPDGTLAAAMALAPRRYGFGLAGPIPSVWVNDFGPLGTPLLAADRPVEAWAAVLDLVAARAGSFGIPYLRLDGPAFAALAQAVAARGGRLVVADRHARAALTPAAGLNPDKKRRKEWARLGRRLAESGPFADDVATDPAAVAAGFEAFAALEAASWKGRAGTSLADQPAARRFVGDALAALAAEGRAAIDRLAVAGRPVALLLRIRQGGTWFPWKIAHDEAFAGFSPGLQVMLRASERMLAEPGFERADSLAVAGHPMIEQVWAGRMEVGTVLIDLGGRGARARLAGFDLDRFTAAKAIARRLRDRLTGR